MSDNGNGGSFIWFLAGLGIGAVVGIMYAPHSGDETREVLLNKAGEGREYVKSRARGAADQASQWADRGKDAVNQQKEQFKAAYEAGRQAYQDATAEPAAQKTPIG